MTTTPTGIPITDCSQCGYTHPVTRHHCPVCGLATLFNHEECRAPSQPSIFDAMEPQP